MFIRYLAEIAKIIEKIIMLVRDSIYMRSVVSCLPFCSLRSLPSRAPSIWRKQKRYAATSNVGGSPFPITLLSRTLLQIPMTAMPCHPCTIGKQDSKVAFEYVSPPSLASNSCHTLANVFLSIGLPAEKIIILPISFCFGAPP